MTPLHESPELHAVRFLREEIERTALPAPARRWIGVRRRGLLATLISAFTAIPAALIISLGASSTAPALVTDGCRAPAHAIARRDASPAPVRPVLVRTIRQGQSFPSVRRSSELRACAWSLPARQ